MIDRNEFGTQAGNGEEQRGTPARVSHVAFVLDASTSMWPLHQDVPRVFGELLAETGRAAAASDQTAFVSLWTFSNPDAIRPWFQHLSPVAVPPLDGRCYRLSGGTALVDAVMTAGDALQAGGGGTADGDEAFLLVVVTDGGENASRARPDTLRRWLREKAATDRWTVTFMVPEGHEPYLAALGVPGGNVRTWEPTAEGLGSSSGEISSSLGEYFLMRARGERSTREFYGASRQGRGNVRTREVVVVRGSHDHVGRVLRRKGVEFDSMEPMQLLGCDWDRLQVLLVNCPGELPPAALRRLGQWVRAGGYLLTTDWALTHVLEPLFLGTVRRPAGPRFTDCTVAVEAAADLDDPLLVGLLGTRPSPVWRLEADSCPIEVIDRDRVRVLLRSRELGERWGSDAVAVTFRHGEGTVVHLLGHLHQQRRGTRSPGSSPRRRSGRGPRRPHGTAQ